MEFLKSKVFTIVSTSVLCLSLLAMPVKADPFNGGFAIGFVGNFSDMETSGTETEGNAANTNTATETHNASHSESVDFGSLLLEYNIRDQDILGGYLGMTLGFDWVPGTASLGARTRTDSTGESAVENDTGDYTAKAEIEHHISAYIEPTLYAGKYVGFFAKTGLVGVTVRSLESIANGESSSAYGDEFVGGIVLGAGMRLVTGVGLFAKVSYEYTDYNQVVLTSTQGNKNKITADPEQQGLKFAIGYQF